jgi:alkylated DNA repair dioxygenase AlkB
MTTLALNLAQYNDPITKGIIAQESLRRVRPDLKAVVNVNPYAIPTSAALVLEKLGIGTHPMSLAVHPHAPCKAIENQILNTVGHLLPKEQPVTFMAMKKSKLNMLRRHPSRADTFINPIYHPRDNVRYGLDPDPDQDASITASFLEVKTSTAFMQDTLHYLTPEDLLDIFETSPKLENLIASFVLPVEATRNMKSLYPDLYSIHYTHGGFQWAPSGHLGDAYFHEPWQLYWLRCGSLTRLIEEETTTTVQPPPGFGGEAYTRVRKEVRELKIYAERVTSIGAHHLFIFSRNAKATPRVRSYSQNGKWVTLPRIFRPVSHNVQTPLKQEVANSLMLYTYAVRPSLKDVAAKVRQKFDEKDLAEHSPLEITHLINYIYYIDQRAYLTNDDDILSDNLLKRWIFTPIQAAYKKAKGFLLGPDDFQKLLKALEWQPVTFDYAVDHYKSNPWRIHASRTGTKMRQLKNFLSRTTGLCEAVEDDALEGSELLKELEGNMWFRNPSEVEKEVFDAIVADLPPDSQRSELILEGPNSNARDYLPIQQDQPSVTQGPDEAAQTQTSTATSMVTTSVAARMPPPVPRNLREHHEQFPTTVRASFEQPNSTRAPETSENNTPAESVTPSPRAIYVGDFAIMDANASTSRTSSPTPRRTVVSPRQPEPQNETLGRQIVSRVSPAHGCQMSPYAAQLAHQLSEQTAYTDVIGQRMVAFYSQHSRSYKYGRHEHRSQSWLPVIDSLQVALGLDESYDHCLIQRYRKQARVGLHADDEECYEPDSTIVTLNLYGNADFLIERNTDKASETITLQHNDMLYMPSGMQVTHRHAVCSLYEGRVSITFRNQTKDYLRRSAPDMNQVEQPGASAGQLTGPLDHRPEELPWEHWIPRLNRLGFTGLQKQTDPEGKLIYPITEIRQDMVYVPFPNCCPGPLRKDLEAMGRRPVRYTVDTGHALTLASDIRNNRVGALLQNADLTWKTLLVEYCRMEPTSVPMTVIHGAGGSGKSKLLQDHLNRAELNVVIIVPTRVLQQDWRNKMTEFPSFLVQTYEAAMMESAPQMVIFDDYGKLPHGYIDLFCQFHPSVEYVILTGDARQSTYYEYNSDAGIRNLPTNIEVFKQYCGYYINCTHRNKQDLANMLGVYSEKMGSTHFTFGNTCETGSLLLVPSGTQKTVMGEAGHKTETYAGCQGITADKVQIMIDHDTHKSADSHMYTALSRATEHIHFYNSIAGLNTARFHAKLNLTPYLKTFIQVITERAAAETEPAEYTVQAPTARTHIPVENCSTFLEKNLEEQRAKEDREVYTQAGATNVFQTNSPIVQCFQHQQPKDGALSIVTHAKRLQYASAEANQAEYRAKLQIGAALWENFKTAMEIPDEPVPFIRDLWEQSEAEVLSTYLSKSEMAIKNGKNRQDPDWQDERMFVYLKAQWVTKASKFNLPTAKAGQTISAFKQEVVMKFGAMARYLRRITPKPDNIRINCEMQPQDISKWALGLDSHNRPTKQKWNFERPAFASDFEAFDQSQDGAMLHFEALWARHFNVPSSLIEEYLFLKMHAQAPKGYLTIMRLTGEGPTFDANTACSIAYNHTRYEIPKSCMQLYAGDDMLLDQVPVEKTGFKNIAAGLKLTAKTEVFEQKRGKWGEFCSWWMTPYGLVKDPITLYHRILLASEIGDLSKKIDAYAIEAEPAYALQGRLFDCFNEEQMTAHYGTIRRLIIEGKTNFSLDDQAPRHQDLQGILNCMDAKFMYH